MVDSGELATGRHSTRAVVRTDPAADYNSLAVLEKVQEAPSVMNWTVGTDFFQIGASLQKVHLQSPSNILNGGHFSSEPFFV